MRDHHTAYDRFATLRCERVLLTLLGNVGPWSERIYLAGGLAPRYLAGRLPAGTGAHVGTTDATPTSRSRATLRAAEVESGAANEEVTPSLGCQDRPTGHP